jgi:hypothetical protein
LLEEVVRRKSEEGVWLTLAGEVDQWWRQRSAMKLVPSGSGWKIEGPGSERARLAYAYLDGRGWPARSAPETLSAGSGMRARYAIALCPRVTSSGHWWTVP